MFPASINRDVSGLEIQIREINTCINMKLNLNQIDFITQTFILQVRTQIIHILVQNISLDILQLCASFLISFNRFTKF